LVLGHPGLLLRAAAAPFLLSVLLAAVTLVAPAHPLLSVVFAVAGLVPYAIFGVAWSRVTLLGMAAARPPLAPAWAPRHWRFFGYLAAVGAVAFGLVVPPLIFGAIQAYMAATQTPSDAVMVALLIAEIVVVVGILYFLARLSFVFPAAAVDEAYGLRHAWAHTRDQGLRLLATLAFSVVPMLALLWAVAVAFGVFSLPEFDPSRVHDAPSAEQAIAQYLADNAGHLIFAQVVMTVMSYLLMGLALSAMALAFRACTGWVPAVAPPPAET
jgi:MFS family permease